MSRAHDLPAQIQWHEGMLLAPQHFQQLCQRQDKVLYYHLRQASAFHYGIVRVKVDQPMLFEGRLRLLELEAVMPDGLIVSHTTAGEDLLVDLRPYADAAKQEPVMVHLIVPAERPDGSQAQGEHGRFTSYSGDPVSDETTGTRPLRIPRLRPRVRLLAGNDPPPARFCAMPLFSVRYKNGAFVLGEYIPPMLGVPTDSVLGETLTQVSRRIRDKGMYLMEIIRSPAITTKPEVIEENRRLISYLMTHLPAFESLARTGVTHPYPIYTALCALAGSVAAIGNQMIPPVFLTYDHMNIRKVFDEVIGFIFQSIDEGISEAFTAIPFKLDADLFSLKFERDWLTKVLIIGAKSPPGTPDQVLLDWMATSLIGTSGKYKVLRDRRLLGSPRQAIDRYEGLVATRGTLLFQLKVDPEWIAANESLIVGNAGGPSGRPAEMFLYVANKG